MKVKKTRPWNPASYPTYWINHASRLLMHHFEQRLRPLGFGTAYLPVAVALKERGPMLQKQLTELAHVEQPTMAALLGRMERDGLIIRQIDPRDKRSTRLSLSTKGIERLPEAKEGLQEIADDAIKGLSGEEMAILIALLRRVIANLEEKKSDSRIS
jgi:MarR family transcriptional regulator for hemolysin